MKSDAEIALVKELIRVQRAVIEIAVTESAEAAVDMIGEYFEEAGVDDDETRRMLDMWWTSRPHHSRVREIERRG